MALFSFLVNPNFWKGVSAIASGFNVLRGSKGEGGEASSSNPYQQAIDRMPVYSPPRTGFPSIQNINYGEIIAKMLAGLRGY